MAENNLNIVNREPALTQAEWEEWHGLKAQIAEFAPKVQREMELRKKIARTYFPAPTEGVNDVPLSDGLVMKYTHSIDRKVQPEEWSAIADEVKEAGINAETLVVMKPSLSTTAYKALTEEQRKIVDKALEIKVGSVKLEIVKPKR